jgi:hypothetical protein
LPPLSKEFKEENVLTIFTEISKCLLHHRRKKTTADSHQQLPGVKPIKLFCFVTENSSIETAIS